MAEIIEVPIETSETIAEEIPETEPKPEPASKPKPKPKGRPRGALGQKKKETIAVNDVPQKAHKKKTKPPPPSEYESEEEEAPPPKRKRIQQQVYEPDNRAIAAEVLHMLSNRYLDRSAAKREKYRSWFSNPY